MSPNWISLLDNKISKSIKTYNALFSYQKTVVASNVFDSKQSDYESNQS